MNDISIEIKSVDVAILGEIVRLSKLIVPSDALSEDLEVLSQLGAAAGLLTVLCDILRMHWDLSDGILNCTDDELIMAKFGLVKDAIMMLPKFNLFDSESAERYTKGVLVLHSSYFKLIDAISNVVEKPEEEK